MNKLTIKERILKTLLESPKTTGKIAIELGYIDDKGHGKYNIIKPDLNTLEQYGFIHRIESIKSVGAPATTYDIVYKIPDLREILIKYPSLISDLQKSDKIISMFAKEVMPKTYSPDGKEEPPDTDFFKLFKDMLRLSPSLFEDGFKVDSFLSKWYTVDSLIKSPGYFTMNNETSLEAFFEHGNPIYNAINRIFEHCVIEDILNDVSTQEALNLLNKIKIGITLKGKQIKRYEVVHV
jgi:hypothetical protein